jgi:elongation factor Ts
VHVAANDKNAVIVEINSETDFVALNKDFKELVSKVAKALLEADFNSDKEASQIKINGTTIEELCEKATVTIGEKISFRRALKVTKKDSEFFGPYTHVNGKIAAIVKIEGGNSEAAKNVAMHVSAMNPQFLNREAMPANDIANHKNAIMNELKDIDKPENIKEKMAEGKLGKILADLTLVDQAFVMESKQSVKQYLKSANATATFMIRYEVGEGIEKNEVDFAKEVASQMQK